MSYCNNYGQVLNAGSGIYPFKNAINVDKYIKQKNTINGDIILLPFQDNTFDYVFALEILEHLKGEKQIKAIKECYRVLKNKGQFIITIPNYALCMQLLQNIIWKIRLYTTQRIYLSKIPEHVNKSEPITLKNRLENNGFKIINARTLMVYDYLVIAQKNIN